MLPLVMIGTAAKLLLSAALTYRTRLWWAPGVALIAVGIGVARLASPGLGTFAIALGAAAVTTTRVVRRRAHSVQSTRADGF